MTPAGVTHNVLAPRSFPWRFSRMEDRAPVVNSAVQQSTTTRKREGSGAWVLTAYATPGLALFGLLAYFFSDFISHSSGSAVSNARAPPRKILRTVRACG